MSSAPQDGRWVRVKTADDGDKTRWATFVDGRWKGIFMFCRFGALVPTAWRPFYLSEKL
jgi:hypothetical protein